MAVKIIGNKIENCGTGISTPKEADVEIGNNDITNCDTAIELRDPPRFLASLGLKEDTPTEKVVAVLNAIYNGRTDEQAIESEIKQAGLLDYLSGAANLTTLVSGFYQLSNSSLVERVITLLSK